LAATLLRRAMIEDTLDGAKSSRYKHAARHLLECLSLESSIQDFVLSRRTRPSPAACSPSIAEKLASGLG
jgi:hypothetical protein